MQKQPIPATYLHSNGLVFLEKLGFFMLLIFLYQHLTSDHIRLHPNDTAPLLLLLTNAALFARVFGGLIVDFVLSTKTSLILGISLQFVGVIMLTSNHIGIIYSGMIPFVLGQALFMPALLKRNSINLRKDPSKLYSLNYSNFLVINLAAIAVSFFSVKREYGMQTSSITMAMVYIPYLLALVLSFLSRSTPLSERDLIQETEEENPVHSNRILALGLIGISVFIFCFKATSLRISFYNSIYQNLNELRNLPGTGIYVFAFIALSILPPLGMAILSYFKRIQPFLLGSVFFLGGMAATAGLYLINNQVFQGQSVTLVLVFAFLSLETFLVPLLLTLIQHNCNLKHQASWIGLALSFSGFFSVYLAEKIFGDSRFGFWNYASSGNSPFYITMIGLLLMGALFLMAYLKKKEVKKQRFEDVDDL